MTLLMTFAAFFEENYLLFGGAIAVLATLITLEFRSWQTRGADISTTGLSQTVNDGALLVDLRRHDDYRAGHIAGAHSIPFEELDSHLEKLGDKDNCVVFYCYAGGLSAKTITKLRKAGYSNIKHLSGGIDAWKMDNLPLTKG